MKKLLLSLLLSVSLFGATGATAVWELRNAGTDTNGAGFDTGIASFGTDLSVFDNKNAAACTSCQSTSVNISTTDAVTTDTTTVTSATGNFSSALIGNAIYLTGTGTTTGWYWVSAVASAVSITVDRATGSTGGTGVTMNIGGAIKTFSQATTNVVAGNKVWAKSAATFSISSGITWNTVCTVANPCTIEGYTTSRGDNGQATIQASGAIATMFGDSGNVHFIKNLICDANSKATTSCFNQNGTQNYMYNVTAKNFTVKGVTLAAPSSVFSGGLITGGTSCTAGINTQARVTVQDSRITANACSGIITTITGGAVLIRNIVDSNTGASSDGINLGVATGSSAPLTVLSNVIYSNGRHGIFVSIVNGADNTVFANNIISGNTTDGVNSTSTVYPASVIFNYNAYWNNGGDTGSTTTHNLVNFSQGANDACASACAVTISGDPYVSAGTNFALNNTAAQGAALRAAGYPGVLSSGGTGYLDMGALQHQDSGGGGATPSYPIAQ